MTRRSLPTLRRREHALASSTAQLEHLASVPLPRAFEVALASAGSEVLRRDKPSILQLNLGKRCNQTCHHCHVDAGPDRREVMSDDVLEAALSLLQSASIPVLDITGGAPELHPRFRELVQRARGLGAHVMDRCNLTITQVPSHADLPEFFREHRVEVVASLPWWRASETDKQRGDGVFESSLAALRRLNDVGYGKEDGLTLTLVTNPAGAFLPPDQHALERDYKRELARRYGIVFNRLYTITNMPISRYLEWLVDSGNLEPYMKRLASAFNPATLAGLMCRSTISVGWDGKIYDCDFNQMLDLAWEESIFDLRAEAVSGRVIRTAAHCYGCTAGAGSSCGGATAGS
jgi:radical SAM/Cys-rich protein